MDVTGEMQLAADREMIKKPEGDGCNIHGLLELHRVDGEFHVAFGRISVASERHSQIITATQKQAIGHIHVYTTAEIRWFNASHIVRHIQFGDVRAPISYHPSSFLSSPFAGAPKQPLDGEAHYVLKDHMRYLYLIKLVPVEYRTRDGRVTGHSYQYTYTLQETQVVLDRPNGPQRQPGVFFRFSLSPYTVVMESTSEPLSHVLASIVSIIGGVATISAAFARFTEKLVDKSKKKMEEGNGTFFDKWITGFCGPSIESYETGSSNNVVPTASQDEIRQQIAEQQQQELQQQQMFQYQQQPQLFGDQLFEQQPEQQSYSQPSLFSSSSSSSSKRGGHAD